MGRSKNKNGKSNMSNNNNNNSAQIVPNLVQASPVVSPQPTAASNTTLSIPPPIMSVTLDQTWIQHIQSPLTEKIFVLEAEKKQLEQKYTTMLEENHKKHAEEIGRLQKEIVVLEGRIRELQNQYETLMKKSEKTEESLFLLRNQYDTLTVENENTREKLLLGELALQVEKFICRRVLGKETYIHNIGVMYEELKTNEEFNENWSRLKKEIQWNASLSQAIKDLKKYRLQDGHPIKTVAGQPITEDYLKTLAEKHFPKNIYINRLISILSKYSEGKPNIFKLE